jgi:3-oxoacyl-[acyl-carrier-protein] synthase I
MALNRVYIRGCGAVTALGNTQREIARACRDGGARPERIRLPHSCDHSLPYYALPGETDEISSSGLYLHIDTVVDDAIRDAALTPEEILDLPVFVGSTACDISDLETRYQHDLRNSDSAFPLYRSGFGVLAGYVIDRLQSRGQEFSFNTACSSSANALLIASRMIAHGRIDNALILGVEVRNQMSIQGFNIMMLLSPQACRPFDQHRDGTVLGEGVGAIILSRRESHSSAYAEGNPYYCVGGANLTDSDNITSSSADMIAAVMRLALDQSALTPHTIDIIKAHGTGTPANDGAEAQGMKRVFGPGLPPFTSLKPYIGHTLGACGVMETIVMLACAKDHFIPATPGFAAPDAECACQPLTEPRPFSGGTIMLNYFGFGGNNSSLLFSNRP